MSTCRRPSSGASFDSADSGGSTSLFTIRMPRPALTMRPVTPAADIAIEDAWDFQDPISEDTLREVSGRDDLSEVTYLEMSVDASDQSVSRIGELLPNLKQLKLNDSVLPSIRDLGTSVRNLSVLWLSRCGIVDLDGIGVLDNLRELYLSFNKISDVTPLAMHEHLEVLDLEGNLIADVDQLDSLGTCCCLTALTLDANPITRRNGYRRLANHYVSHLEVLDDEPMGAADRTPIDEAMLGEALRPLPPDREPSAGAGMGDECAVVADSVRSRFDDFVSPRVSVDSSPASSPVVSPVSRRHFRRVRATTPDERPRTSLAPRRPSVEKQWQAFKRDAGLMGASSRSLPTTPVTSAPSPNARRLLSRMGSSDTDVLSASSTLTHGSGVVMAGNPVLAIRRQRGQRARSDSKEEPDEDVTVTDVLDQTARLSMASRDTVVAEMKAWNLEEAAAQLKANPARREALAARRPGTSAGVRYSRPPSTPPRSPSPSLASSLPTCATPPPEARATNQGDAAGLQAPRVDRAVAPAAAMRRPQTSAGSAVGGWRSQPASHFGLSRRFPSAEETSWRPPLPSAPPRGAAATDPDPASTTPPSGEAAAKLEASKPLPSSAQPTADVMGEATFASDGELVRLLRQRPKHVPILRSRDSFRRYFQGMPHARMEALLNQAYSSLSDTDRTDKVHRRLGLLDGLLT